MVEYIPVSIFIGIVVAMILFGAAAVGLNGPAGVFSGFISIILGFISSKLIISGNVVEYFSGITTSNNIIVSQEAIQSASLSQVFLLFTIMMVFVTIFNIFSEIRNNFNPDNLGGEEY